jgi:hypothetical protein
MRASDARMIAIGCQAVVLAFAMAIDVSSSAGVGR